MNPTRARPSLRRRVLCNMLGIPALEAGRHLTDEQVLGILKEDFREDVWRFNDYSGGALVDAFWLGYQRAVEAIRSGADA